MWYSTCPPSTPLALPTAHARTHHGAHGTKRRFRDPHERRVSHGSRRGLHPTTCLSRRLGLERHRVRCVLIASASPSASSTATVIHRIVALVVRHTRDLPPLGPTSLAGTSPTSRLPSWAAALARRSRSRIVAIACSCVFGTLFLALVVSCTRYGPRAIASRLTCGLVKRRRSMDLEHRTRTFAGCKIEFIRQEEDEEGTEGQPVLTFPGTHEVLPVTLEREAGSDGDAVMIAELENGQRLVVGADWRIVGPWVPAGSLASTLAGTGAPLVRANKSDAFSQQDFGDVLAEVRTVAVT